MMLTPIDKYIGRDNTQLSGLPGGWVVGLLAPDNGENATKFAQTIVDLNFDECEAMWVDTLDFPGEADVIFHACGIPPNEMLDAVDTMSNAVDLIIIDNLYSYQEKSIPTILKTLQTIAVESRIVIIVTGLLRDDGSSVGGRAWQNHCDLIVHCYDDKCKVTWWPESEPTGEWISMS